MKGVMAWLSEQYWFYRIKWSKKPIIFIFQMAKVGSSTVHFSLKKYFDGVIVHSHDFNGHHRLSKVRALFRYFSKYNEAKIKLITLVRDPINRNISAFFQDFQRYNGIKFEESSLSHDEIKSNFLQHLKHEQPLIWLDRMKEHFDIDIYEKPFIGHDHVLFDNRKGVELILFRHDLDNTRKAALLREYLNMEELAIENFNTSIKRVYGSAYRSFKKELKLPEDYISMMTESKYYQHFYSKEEIEEQVNAYR